MLDRRNRLTSSAQFTAVTRRGRRAGSRSLVVHVLHPAAGADEAAPGPVASSGPVVGFVVSRAVGNAVVRNRVQRRLRHLVRARLELLPAGASVVVRALPASAGTPYGGLEGDLDTALRRLGVATGTGDRG